MKRSAFGSLLLVSLAAVLVTLAPRSAPADGGGGGGAGGGGGGGAGGDGSQRAADPIYAQAAALIDADHYEQAIPLLNQLIARNPANADAHNLLGYSTRKLGRLQEALDHYRAALRIDPGHRGAHEYMGEAYLELGRLDQAKEQLAFLNKDCWLPCREYTDLKEAVARYEAQARHG